jgi:hypothetical protein
MIPLEDGRRKKAMRILTATGEGRGRRLGNGPGSVKLPGVLYLFIYLFTLSNL